MREQQIEQSEKRRMDCIDCHNRPTHIYLTPNQAVDQSLAAGRLDVTLPFIKAKAVEVLSGQYNTTDEAVGAIAGNDFRLITGQNYPQIFSARQEP